MSGQSYDSIDDIEARAAGKRRTEVSMDQAVVALRSSAPIWIALVLTIVMAYHLLMTGTNTNTMTASPSTTTATATTSSLDMSLAAAAAPPRGGLPVPTPKKAPSAPTSSLRLISSSLAFDGTREVLSSVFAAIEDSVKMYKRQVSKEERSYKQPDTGITTPPSASAPPPPPLSPITDSDAAALNLAVKALRVNIRRIRCVLGGTESLLGPAAPVLLQEWIWFFRIMVCVRRFTYCCHTPYSYHVLWHPQGPASDLGVLLEQFEQYQVMVIGLLMLMLSY
jgi:hypothetical protein